MKNLVKTGFYSTVGVALLSLNKVVMAIEVDRTKQGTSGDQNRTGSFVETLDRILGYFVGLLYFIAILYALYGGFNILTAGGDEEKVKKGKTTLINAVIGLVVIFLASQIVNWAITAVGGLTSGA